MSNLIFRLEHRTQMYYRSSKVHAGFYRVVHEIGMVRAFMEDDNLSERSVHPCPNEDSKLARVWNSMNVEQCQRHFFGFDSFAQFKRWFYRDTALRDIQEHVCLRVYRCEEIIHGYTQAIFNVDKDVELLAEFNPDVKADEVYAVLGDYLATEV